jgi:hypothetical protein
MFYLAKSREYTMSPNKCGNATAKDVASPQRGTLHRREAVRITIFKKNGRFYGFQMHYLVQEKRLTFVTGTRFFINLGCWSNSTASLCT